MTDKSKRLLSLGFTFIAMVVLYLNSEITDDFIRYIIIAIAMVSLVFLLITIVKKDKN